MSIVINGIRFHEIPSCCGYCPAFLSRKEDNRGFCIFFNKQNGNTTTFLLDVGNFLKRDLK